MKIKWLRTALKNLDQALDHIAKDDRQAAVRILHRVQATVELLNTHPALGRPGRVAETRELVISGTPFVIPYRIKEETVEILRVFHGAQDYPKDISSK